MSIADWRFTFDLKGAPGEGKVPSFEVVSFELLEGLSRTYVLDIELSSHDHAIDFAAVLDQPALLTVWRGDEPQRYVHGVVSCFEAGDVGHRRARYRARIEPQLARMALSAGWRVHQHKTAPAILAEMAKRAGALHIEQILTKEHLSREYCVQAGEVDLHFFERLCAEEGMYYAITSSATGHQVILSDRMYVQGTADGGAVIYNATPGGDEAQPCLRSFHYAERVRTAKAVQRDYTFKNPAYNQQHTHAAPKLTHQSTSYEHYAYPGRYKRDEAGKPFTEARLLGLRGDARTARVEGNDPRITPGFAFDLAEAPPQSQGIVGWRVLSMVHTGIQHTSQEEDAAEAHTGTHYSYTADIIPDTVEWRPVPLPKPRIDGPLIAVVTGPQNEEVHCDEFGRVRVQFPWDREGENNEHSSCWVRVSHSWAGTRWGHQTLPRIGQEVVVAHLDGDPDQPIIIGRTHPATQPPPYELPKFHALSPLRSKELKGKRHNELRLDDTSGQISAALMSDHGDSALHLGYLTHPRPRGGEPRGEGFELRTDEHGAVRAGKGLLLTTDGQSKAQGGQLSRTELIQCLEGALALARQLGEYGEQHQGLPHDAVPQRELSDAANHLGYGANDQHQASSDTQPVLALSSPAGIAAATSQSVTVAAGRHIDSVAEQNQQFTAGQTMVMNAGQGIGMFAHAGPLKQIAHQGPIILQAQQHAIRLEAQRSVELYANDEHVLVVAKKHLTLMCDGAYIKLANGDMDLVCPGTMRFRAGTYDMDGASSGNVELPQFDVGDTQRRFVALMAGSDQPVPNMPYKVHLSTGEVVQGLTSAAGATSLLQKSAMHVANLHLSRADDNAAPEVGASPKAAVPIKQDGTYSQTFVLTDKATGAPLAGAFYRITTTSGQALTGQADRQGLTQTVYTDGEEEASVEIYEAAPALQPTWDHTA